MLKQSKWGIVACLFAVSMVAGCSSKGDYPDTAAVSGTVTYNGNPLPGATITFSPMEDGGTPAFAKTGPQGNYTLATFGINDGAVPGKYKVTVMKMTESAQGDEGSTSEDPSAAYLAMEAQGVDVIGGGGSGVVGGGKDEATDLIPARYKDQKTSGLEAEIPKEGRDDVNFDLTG